MPRRASPWLALLLLALVLSPTGWCQADPGRPDNPPKPNPSPTPAPGPASPVEAARPPEPIVVLVGVFFLDVWGLDVARGVFNADFYVWFRWKDEKFDTNGIEFMNAQGLPVISENERVVLGEERYVCLRVRGVFKGSFPIHKYPFDSQRLEIAIEHQMLETHQMVFVADSKMYDGSERDLNVHSRERDLRVAGWAVRGASQETAPHIYATDWGHPRPTGKQSTYSRYTFTIEIARVLFPYLMKFLLPLVVIVLVSFLVFFIDASRFAEQCAIGLASFLSAILFHSIEARSLPEVGYLVVADKFFILSYFVIFLTIVQTVVGQGLFERGAVEKARMMDLVSRVVFPVMYAVGLLALFLKNLE